MDKDLDMSQYGAETDDYPCCDECGTEMEYSFTLNRYKCPNCGYEIDEDDYDPSDYGDGSEYEPNYENYGDEDEMPEGCRACGGPWPECKTSCSMYDD